MVVGWLGEGGGALVDSQGCESEGRGADYYTKDNFVL